MTVSDDRSLSCPEGHGPLEEWEGEMRCWTCAWTPAKGEANTSDTTTTTEEEVEAVKKPAPRAGKPKNPCYCCFNREKRKNLHIKFTIRDGNLTVQTPISIPLCQVCLNNAPASEMTDGVRRRLAETSEDSVVVVNGSRIDRTKEISDQAILPTLSNALSKERSKKKSQ